MCNVLCYTFPMPSLKQAVYGPTPIQMRWIEWLVEAAADTAREARKGRTKTKPRFTRPRVTLRPGPDTPLWNELVRQLRPHLRKYGAKAQLARLLGLPRQRLHDCLKAGSACA